MDYPVAGRLTATIDNSSAEQVSGFFNSKYCIIMKKYVCDVCGYEYDPEVGDPDNGIEPGTAFEDLPEDWVCPLCSVGKDQFSPVD